LNISTNIGVWIAAICTIGIMSLLYGDNRMFKMVEAGYIGFAAAHSLVLGYQNIVGLAWTPLVKKGDWLSLIPIVAGLLLYTRFLTKYSWIAKFPLQFLYGIGAGVAIRGAVGAQVLAQISSTIYVPKNFNDVIVILGTLLTMSYFFFTIGEKNPVMKYSAQVGRWVMMVAFGATFGSFVMGRTSSLIARLTFLWGNWLGVIK
jgi:lipoprotein signal peptidase